MIYQRIKNLRAIQLLFGHSKLENTVRYLGIEVDDALEIADRPKTDISRLRGTNIYGVKKHVEQG